MPTYEKIDNEILSKNFLNDFRKGYVSVEGFMFPDYFRTISERIETFSVCSEDVWVCSFPKTGTTWTQEMVWMIANNLDFEGSKEVLADRFPFLEVTSLFDFSTLMSANNQFKPPRHLIDSIGYVKSLKEPRFIKTHLPFHLLPKQIQNNNTKPKIIYVVRNSKDTCVSYYHHARLIEGYTGNFEDFCKLFLGGRVCFGPFWKHVLSFWERRHQENILFIKYEDMKKNLPAIIRRVAKFMDKELTEEQIDKLTEHLSFESMKNNKAVNYDSIVELNRKFNLTEDRGAFMRSGTVGNYKAVMTPDLIEQFDAWTEESLRGTGFSFDD